VVFLFIYENVFQVPPIYNRGYSLSVVNETHIISSVGDGGEGDAIRWIQVGGAGDSGGGGADV
jgi:hypothetical protein